MKQGQCPHPETNCPVGYIMIGKTRAYRSFDYACCINFSVLLSAMLFPPLSGTSTIQVLCKFGSSTFKA